MMTNDKTINLEGMFKGADLSGAQIIAVNEGEVYYTRYGTNLKNNTKTEEQVKNAIIQLMDERDEKGQYLIHDQDQWYGLKAVLTSQHCGFPVKPSEFGKVIKNLGLDELRVRYDSESVRKVHVHQLPANVDLWNQYKNTSDNYSYKQVAVAVRLIEILEEQNK